ncbi:hypothetical protein AB0M95_17240 [Sphaerisporangium sp. NPDC051017]
MRMRRGRRPALVLWAVLSLGAAVPDLADGLGDREPGVQCTAAADGRTCP